jgi:hypothetical protein
MHYNFCRIHKTLGVVPEMATAWQISFGRILAIGEHRLEGDREAHVGI